VIAVNRTALPEVGPISDFKLPAIKCSTLTNGTKLWTAEHSRAPVLSLMLLLPFGAAADSPDQYGLAALTADLLDEGSEARSLVEIHKSLLHIGGYISTEVTSDATVISLTTLARHFREGLTLLSEIVFSPRFDSEDVMRIRDLRCHRIRQMLQSPTAVADRIFLESLYGNHPYGHLSIGTDETLRNLEQTAVKAFHKRWYLPSQMTLVAIGDITEDALREAAEDIFLYKSSKDNRLTTTAQFPDPSPIANRLVFISRPGSVQSEVRIGHVGAARSSSNYYALSVLNMVLGGQFVSRLNLNLREAKGYTYGARTSFDWRLHPGPFLAQFSVDTLSTADAIVETVGEIADISSKRPVTVEELTMAKAALTRGFPKRFETATQIARASIELALHKLPANYYTNFVSRIMAVDINNISEVAKLHLRSDELIAIVVGASPNILDNLSSLGFGDPVVRGSYAGSE